MKLYLLLYTLLGPKAKTHEVCHMVIAFFLDQTTRKRMLIVSLQHAAAYDFGCLKTISLLDLVSTCKSSIKVSYVIRLCNVFECCAYYDMYIHIYVTIHDSTGN